MSALTKLFVVLLVVCSLLLTASVVVFVARSENLNEKFRSESDKVRKVTEERNLSRTQAEGLQARLQEMSSESNKQNSLRESKITQLTQALADRDIALAKKEKDLSLLGVSLTTSEGNLKAALDRIKQKDDQIAILTKESDSQRLKNSDLNALATDLQNKLDATERERRYNAEQLAEAQNKLTKAEATLKEHGIAVAAAPARPSNDQPINGVIDRVDVVNQIPCATINIGSAENVQKGMQFKVVNMQTGEFYGVLTVDMVQQNKAIGRLEGPRVAEVKAGLEVRTQL